MKVYECDLDCCLSMWHWDGTEIGFLTDVAPLEDELGNLAGVKICYAHKKSWLEETQCETDEQGFMGGVPNDCPIYQGEMEAPWT